MAMFQKRFDARKYIIAIFLLAFAIRVLPVLMFGVPVGLDSYLHIDIALRIVEKGTLLSFDPLSLIGMKAYSYPPGFHVLLALFLTFLPPVLGSHVLGALIGAATAVIMYYLTKEIFDDERVSLFSAFFMATSPIHIFRSSMPIPEGFGVLLFTVSLLFLIRYMKGMNFRNLLASIGVFCVYCFSHRGWTLFVLTVMILLLVYKHHLFRKKRYVAAFIALIAAAYVGIIEYFSDLIARINVEAVSALGYIKWMGVAQLALAAIAVILLHKTKDRFRMFVVVWAVLLLFIGSFSFRFRDPYGAIPVSMLAGYAVIGYVIPKLKKDKRKLKAMLSLLILVCVVQALATAMFVVEHPTPDEVEALTWIRDNTPEDSIVLTWKEEGYYIIGLSERKDILTWKKIYQGFFEEPPTVDEAQGAYIDMFVMFRSSQKQWMLDLLDGYGVDYIYIDARMRSELDALKYGMFEYLSHDTYFKPVFANDKAEIYKYESDRMLPESHAEPLTSYTVLPDYDGIDGPDAAMSLVPYMEGYWNGIAYIDARDYRAHYPDNSEIARMLLMIYGRTGNAAFRERAEWLMKWLAFEQLTDGGFFDNKYEVPKKSVQATCMVVSDVIDIVNAHPEITEGPSIDRAGEFIYANVRGSWVRTLPTSIDDDYRTDAICLPALAKLSEALGDGKYAEAAKEIEENLLTSQNADGSWQYGTFSDRSTANSQAAILTSLMEYNEMAMNPEIDDAIKLGSKWLSKNQNEKGMFWNFVVERTGRVIRIEQVTYPRAIMSYLASGMQSQATLTSGYLKNSYDPERKDLEALVQIMSWKL